MAKFTMDREEFIPIPVCAKLTSKEAVARYEELLAQAKIRMKNSGIRGLLDTPVQKQPPKLRRRVS